MGKDFYTSDYWFYKTYFPSLGYPFTKFEENQLRRLVAVFEIKSVTFDLPSHAFEPRLPWQPHVLAEHVLCYMS